MPMPDNLSMPSALFDVLVVGHQDLSPGAQLKLAGTIASRHSVAAPHVAEALAGGRCVIGKQLAEPSARQLAADLIALGARTEIQPSSSSSSSSSASSSSSPSSSPLPSLSPRSARPPSPSAAPPPRPTPRRAPAPTANPLKRVLVGAAIALAIGFVPAAYYTFGLNGAEVRRIRARQSQLSDQPGEKPIMDEFDRLDAAVADVRRRGLIHAAVLWILISGIAGAAIYRFGKSDRAA
jgi:hypothetical protein